MPCANGTSVLLRFDSMSKFAEYLLHCASHRNAEQLTLCKLTITKMQQLENRNLNLENRQHENANVNLHTRKLQSSTVHSEVKDDHMKNSTTTKYAHDTESSHAEHSQQIESEKNVALICEICSKTCNNSYDLNLHQEKCKEKQTFVCKSCTIHIS